MGRDVYQDFLCSRLIAVLCCLDLPIGIFDHPLLPAPIFSFPDPFPPSVKLVCFGLFLL